MKKEVQITVVGKVFRPNKKKVLALNRCLEEYFELVNWYLNFNSTSSKHAALAEHDLSTDYLVRRYLRDAEHALDRVEYYCDIDLSDVEEQLSRASSEDDINWVEWSFFERIRKGL